MIYLTGDTHGGIDMSKLSDEMLESKGIMLTANDYVIITGDFGFPFSPSDIDEYNKRQNPVSADYWVDTEYIHWIGWFKSKPCTFLFVDGNHDNHDFWSEQDVTEKFGGKVQIHPHIPNVIHLMRGETYIIDGKTFFTFGGAASVDKLYRVEGETWWKGEETNYAEVDHAIENLEKVGNKVDYIITHTMPTLLAEQIFDFKEKTAPCNVAAFLDRVFGTVEYHKWFCGHFHVDIVIKELGLFMLYKQIIPITLYDNEIE